MVHTSSLSVRIRFLFTLLLRDAFCNFLSNCHIALSSFPNLALKIVRQDLVLDLRRTIYAARKSGQLVRQEGILGDQR